MKNFLRVITCMLVLSLSVGAAWCLAEESGMNYDEYQPLWQLAEQYGFKMGGCFGLYDMNNAEYMNIMGYHFNSITCTNETKAYSLLDQRASKKSEDGMPRMNFTNADKMIAKAQEKGIKVRGHVLVWDAYMTSWFFHEDYDDKKPIVDSETMRLRVRSYIDQVITHFETKFPGVIYCWDVVNEAIGDNNGEFKAADPRHVRTVRNGAPNPFYEYVGQDYVEYSFLCARDTVEALGADIKLFYNDYNMFTPAKRGAACALIDSINSYAQDENGENRKLIDGIGMQGYIGGYGTQNGCLNDSDIKAIRTSIETYAARGMEVQLTEMAVRNYDKDKAPEHAAYYGKLFEMFKTVNSEIEGSPLTAVCIWGINDCPNLPSNNYTWKLNSPYGGLLTEKNKVKTSFDTVYRVLGGE